MHQSLATLLLDTAARRPQAAALHDERDGLAYAELAARVEQRAALLLSLGLGSQDRVGIYLDKSIEAATMLMAVLRAGGIVVPINPRLKAAQVAYILRDSQARILVTTSHRLVETRRELAGLPLRRLLVDAKPPVELLDDDTVALGALLAAPAGPLRPHRRVDTDGAAILYTSGSTGNPKGVVASHRNLVAGCQAVNAYLGTNEDDTLLALLPISFDAGLSQLSTGFAAGAKVVLHTPLHPQRAAAAVAEHRATSITAVPPLWSQLAHAQWDRLDTRSVRLFANTGGHMSAPLLARLRGIFPAAKPFLMYGLTEAFRSTYLDPEEVDRRPGSIGRAIPNAEILVLRPDGTPCDAHEPGELVHRGPLVTMGYWNAPEKTAERFRPLPARLADGLHPELAVWSGDIVRRDEEGFLYFIGRRDEMIKTNGYRISPTEIENVVMGAPGVREVAAFGVPAGDQGDAIFATIVADGDDLDLRAVEAHCARELPNYMVPRLLVVGELPRSANGKIDRVGLRRFCEGVAA